MHSLPRSPTRSACNRFSPLHTRPWYTGASGAVPTLVNRELLDQLLPDRHFLGKFCPECSVDGASTGQIPPALDDRVGITGSKVAVCATSGVEVLKDRTMSGGGELREGRYFGVELVIVVDFVRRCVDVHDTQCRVDVVSGSNRGGHERDCFGRLSCFGGGIVGVKDVELVLVRVSKEDMRNDVGCETVNDLVEQVGRVVERVTSIPTC